MASSSYASEALAGFANGSLYDQYRPSYSEESVTKLLQALRVDGASQATILDLAAGTGKFTSLLAQRREQFHVIAVEPNRGMQEELKKKHLQRVKVSDGLATKIPVYDGSVDAVIAAQAFHWFADMPALTEIHRVLNSTGSLGMIWNVEDYNQSRTHKCATAWEGKLRDLIWTFDDDRPRFRHGKWRQVFDQQTKLTPILTTKSTDPLFSLPIGEDHIPFTVWLSKEDLWKRWRTLSQIAILEGEALKKNRAAFDEILSGDDVEKNDDGFIAVHGNTVLAWTSKIPASSL